MNSPLFDRSKLKYKAISLRKSGYSYSQILQDIPVAKSTLSLWLRDVKLANMQKQALTRKRLEAGLRGAEARKNNRLAIIDAHNRSALLEIDRISKRELWLMGTMLYWAEGAKAKDNNVSARVLFSNSDPLMIKVFLKWVREILGVVDEDIIISLYIHETKKAQIGEMISYWAFATGFPASKFDKIYFKKNKIGTNRKNIGENYFGLIRVCIKRSTDLNRKIAGWTKAICKRCGVV